MAQPYELLAQFYNARWADYNTYVSGLILEIETERHRPFRRVCDAACGTGVLLRILASERQVCGYDRSRQMLTVAQTDPALARVPLKVGDLLQEPPFHGPFDLVTCIHDSLNYLVTDEELVYFFGAVAARLSPDGIFLFDLNDQRLYRARDGLSQLHLIQGVPFRETFVLEEGPPLMGITTFSFPAGTEEHRQRGWEQDEVEALLTDAGLHLVDTMDTISLETEEATGKVVYIATV